MLCAVRLRDAGCRDVTTLRTSAPEQPRRIRTEGDVRRPVMRRGVSTLRRALFLTAVVTAALVGGIPAAQAHDGLAGSTPAQAATVPTPPSEIALQFTGPPQTLGVGVAVTGPDGATISDGAAVVSGTTVVQPLAIGLPAGDYP